MLLPPVIGRYRTRGSLGTGTFATVVLAEDEALAALEARTRRWWAQSLLERASPDGHGARALALAAAGSAERLGMERLAVEAHDLAFRAEQCPDPSRAERS